MRRIALRLILIFILAFTGVKIWYNRLERNMLSSLPEETTVQKKPVEQKKIARTASLDNFQIIVDRNIFRAALEKVEEKVVEEPVQELKPTKLKLSLVGTVSGTSDASRAIISDDTSRKQDIYAVGDTVQGAVIKSIERRRVVLQVNGRDEVLDIKEREAGAPDTAFSPSPEPVVRNTLRERLHARRPVVRPSPRNRQIPGQVPVVEPPVGMEENLEPDNTGIPEENTDEFVDQDTGQSEDMTNENNQDLIEEPGNVDNEPLEEPGVY